MTTQSAPAAEPSGTTAATPQSTPTGEAGHTAEKTGALDASLAGSNERGPAEETDLTAALTGLRAAIAAAAYPLMLPSAEEARRLSAALEAQLDDYLLPRLARLDAPLLAVVGGSTGAGKSTLVNSMVQARVSATGVLRPTTLAPVLVCNPADTPWFRHGEILPDLTRTSRPGDDPHTLQLVAAPALAPGLALLDAPDVDSVVHANRALAAKLLAAADLWLFVTTAARYADAVPWDLLHTARLRGTSIALVLDRVPPEAGDEVAAHLAEMLATHGLSGAPLFVLPEIATDGQGLLPENATRPLRDWLNRLATDAAARAAVVRQTLGGAIAALVPAVEGLGAAADEQNAAAAALDERVEAAYRSARRMVADGVQDGRLLRGEVLARWQEFVGTGELFRALEARIGRLRDRVTAAVSGRPAASGELRSAIESNLVTLIRGAATEAAERAYSGWQAHPAGAALLRPALTRPGADLPDRAERLVRDWQRAVLDLVRVHGANKRSVARGAAYAVNATGLAVMIAVFASTAFIPTGAEVAVAGGTTVTAQKLLEAIFGDQAVRTLASAARQDLLTRVDALLGTEAARFTALTKVEHPRLGDELRALAEEVERARTEAALDTGARLSLLEAGATADIAPDDSDAVPQARSLTPDDPRPADLDGGPGPSAGAVGAEQAPSASGIDAGGAERDAAESGEIHAERGTDTDSGTREAMTDTDATTGETDADSGNGTEEGAVAPTDMRAGSGPERRGAPTSEGAAEKTTDDAQSEVRP